jgi:hypothetical protein
LELDLHTRKVLRMSGWMPLLLQHQMLRVTIIVDEVYLGFNSDGWSGNFKMSNGMQCECDRRETAGGHLFANAVWQSTSTEQRMQTHLFSLLVGQVAGCTKNMCRSWNRSSSGVGM